MTQHSKIEWTEVTWNPVRGCSRISPGCQNCYAELMAARFSGSGQPYERLARFTAAGPRWTGRVRVVEELLELPLKWRKPRVIFTNSMSDLFHEGLPVESTQRVFEVMVKARQHQFQVLTKRSKRLAELAPQLSWPSNIWMGVSVECGDFSYRVDDLRQTDAQVKFISLEPLIGPVTGLDLAGIDWVILGGESGSRARPMRVSWAREVRDQCTASGVKFFLKQWGEWLPGEPVGDGHYRWQDGSVRKPWRQRIHIWPDGTVSIRAGKKQAGRLLDGAKWDEMP